MAGAKSSAFTSAPRKPRRSGRAFSKVCHGAAYAASSWLSPTLTDRHGGMDIDGKHFGYAALQEMRQIPAPAAPQPMANTMPLERVEALVVEKWGQIALRRRITCSDSDEIGGCRGDDRGLVGHGREHEVSKPLDRHGELPKLSGQQ